MKFLGKTKKSFVKGTIALAMLSNGLVATIQPAVTEPTISQIAQVLSSEEVNLRAKQIIVRIDGASVGSGSLIESSNNVYTVLTNWHVMKNKGEYVVRTIDGRQHQVNPNSIKQIPGLDLAIFQFTSNQNYQVAELGNSANLNEGQSIYFAGYPGELRKEDNRYYRFFAANIVGILPKSTENGYSLVYNGEAFPGMSGGPVFNQEGLVIGVHGEANVHALSGGTSNYAIPINTYQEAIAKLEQQPSTSDNSPETVSPSNDQVATEPQPKPQPEPQPEPQSDNSQGVSSVPTFTPEPPQKPTEKSPEKPPEEVADGNEEEVMDESVIALEEEENNNSQPQPKPKPEVEEVESETIEVSTTVTTKKIPLVSKKTGISYKPLRDLLKNEKWSEADLATYKLVEQIVKTAKQKNQHFFIELKTIAEFSCPDIRTIDALWKKYTGNKFGFSSQQEVWQSVNQKGDFSTQTWRHFATEVGWKKGAVDSGSGYLLYEQLDFNPKEAPVGHLPWWFALPDEEQKVIKHLFARCNFNPTPQELAAEEGKNKPKKPNNNTEDNQSD